ncbi:MORN repeat protein [Histomonas meleagridis]|uniref:MORN repeat protein n=1 Tax=Histomonas meleagridis TaxID=135588 RepID=UPI003559954C|nr:MORN repeat protein [Histomonas meleagridis]KAH0801859.1 MORN repeat protein [Histomonas meleagridis]
MDKTDQATKLPHHGRKCNFVFPPKEDGKAVYEYQNTYFKYIGDWKNGKKEGFGKFQIGKDSYYEGEFKNGEITGVGDRFFANGNHYHGEFKEGEFNGHGKFIDAKTGEEYEGEWKNNRRNGEGVLKMPNGTQYIGHFKNHARDGEGKCTFVDGTHYEGQWSHNKIEGFGKMLYPNGDTYEGNFVDGKKQGQGKQTWASNGLSFEGEWTNDQSQYQPTSFSLSELPPITPGTTLDNIIITIVGGTGESGRVIKVSIEIGRIDPNSHQKKTPRTKKNEPVEHIPVYMILDKETESTFLTLTIQNGSIKLPPIPVPTDAKQNTYSLTVTDLSSENPLPELITNFQWQGIQNSATSEKPANRGRATRRGGKVGGRLAEKRNTHK